MKVYTVLTDGHIWVKFSYTSLSRCCSDFSIPYRKALTGQRKFLIEKIGVLKFVEIIETELVKIKGRENNFKGKV